MKKGTEVKMKTRLFLLVRGSALLYGLPIVLRWFYKNSTYFEIEFHCVTL